MRVAPAIEASYGRSRLRGGELLVTLVGTVGEAAVAGPELAGWNVARAVGVARIRPEVGAQWITWVLKLAASTSLISERVNTTVQMTLNLADLRELPVPLPPVEERLRVQSVLNTLDTKIESVRRARNIIDRLIRVIFQGWRLRTSTSARETTFGELADVYGGATPKTSIPDYWDGDIAWTTPTDVTRLGAPYLLSTTRTITDEGLASCSAVVHPTGTIFMTSRATIGAFAMNQLPAATNQGFIAVRPRRDLDRWFLLEEMRFRVPDFMDHANGSTFLEISRGNFKRLPLKVPADSELAELDDLLGPLHRKAAQLTSESERLTGLRDLLLPELLSGRLRALEAAEVMSGGCR